VLLIEIAAQGVRGVSPAGGSTRLRPGYNLVPFEGAALRRLIEALFYPAPRDGEELRGASAGSGPARAGVTLLGNDGVTWRLVRDFAAGCQLQRLDPERRAFTLAAQAMEEVAAVLREQVGVPARGQLALLSLAASDLPTRRCAGMAVHAPQAAVHAPQAVGRRPLAGAEAEKRLAELRAELARAEHAEKLQYQFDGLQSRLFKAEEALREGARLREAAQGAEAALSASGPAAAVAESLGNVEAKLAAHARAVARRDEALAKLEGERAALEDEAARGTPRPFWFEPGFWAGAAAGVAALAVGIWGAGQSRALRYVALLDIPAFAWAAWIALDWVAALEVHGRLGRRRTLLEEHERKTLETFARESAEVRQALQALGVARVGELQEALNRVGDARAAAEEARRKVAEFEASAATRSAEEDRVQVEAELRQVEEALSTVAGGYVRDPRSVEMELQRVQAEADAPGAAPEQEQEREPEPPEVVLAAVPVTVDPLREVLERAARELGVSPAAAARESQVRASHVLGVLSANRLSALSVDDRGNLLAQRSGQSTAAAALSPADRDLVFLALKLAFIERGLAGGKQLAVADDAFAGLSETARRLAGRLLKQLARPGQLIHATADAAFRESADHVA